MDIISLLKEDHREVDALFGRIESASERAVKMKQKLFDQIKAALTVHAAVEEKLLYPRMKELRPLRQGAFDSIEEHRLVKQLLAELSEQNASSEVWNAKIKVLIDMVRHHVQEEETEYFKVLRTEVNRTELRQLGEEVQSFKENFTAPRAPASRGDGASSQLQA